MNALPYGVCCSSTGKSPLAAVLVPAVVGKYTSARRTVPSDMVTGRSSSDPVPYVAGCGDQLLASASLAPVTVSAAAAVLAPRFCPDLAEGAGPLPPGRNGATRKVESVMTRASAPITRRQGTVPFQRAMYQSCAVTIARHPPDLPAHLVCEENGRAGARPAVSPCPRAAPGRSPAGRCRCRG